VNYLNEKYDLVNQLNLLEININRYNFTEKLEKFIKNDNKDFNNGGIDANMKNKFYIEDNKSKLISNNSTVIIKYANMTQRNESIFEVIDLEEENSNNVTRGITERNDIYKLAKDFKLEILKSNNALSKVNKFLVDK
jgi:hypothetical protein